MSSVLCRRLWRFLWAALIVLLLLLAVLAYWEMRTSRLQSEMFSRIASKLTYVTATGPSNSLRYPLAGPYDQRLGYTELADFVRRLSDAHYGVATQARLSLAHLEWIDSGIFPIYSEKAQAGLHITDKHGYVVFSARYPERVFADFESIPAVIVRSLLFIENRTLLDPRYPNRNPAVEWKRLGKAVLGLTERLIGRENSLAGGSTLATQIEKYRHSPGGQTADVQEKIRQMLTASLRAYRQGPNTLVEQRRIVLDYLNSVPLTALRGYGEISGLGDGLWAWYDADLNTVIPLLADANADVPSAAQALAFKQVLSLMLAERRPSFYLAHPVELNRLADRYLGLLAAANIISPALRDAALGMNTQIRAGTPTRAPVSFLARKAANSVRARLVSLLQVPRLYDLDRLDLSVASTLDSMVQAEITAQLVRLRDKAAVVAAGLKEARLLGKGDPAEVLYSFTLLERTAKGNAVRVQTDNYDQPFNINEGVKLDLGSSAKLRTLVNYLQIIAELHSRLAPLSAQELRVVEVDRRDRLSAWAVDYLRTHSDRNLAAMLQAAMGRRYSASPAESFFTGGGLHHFVNFKRADDYKVADVWEALRESVNLVFIRMMRDIVYYYMFQVPGSTAKLLEDTKDVRRTEYLARFADREGQVFIRQFYAKYAGKTQAAALDLFLDGLRPTPTRLSTVYRYLMPTEDAGALAAFLRARLPGSNLSTAETARLYERYGPGKFTLSDQAYIARAHPLELWLLRYLRQHPQATLAETVAVSANERQEVYRWLFKTRRKNAQDIRIRNLLEVEAFLEIHKAWQRVGYPFDSLVPSYATAIGSSADRPVALAELMGILVNDGMHYPTHRISELHFAAHTPYETLMRHQPAVGTRVLPAEVAAVARQALIGVVQQGTAARLHGVFKLPDGSDLIVGGKTGTGDHRRDRYGSGGRLLSSRVVNRAATFVFILGERHFGVITAFVPGPAAANYDFTSALPVQILKILSPHLTPLLRTPPA